MRESEHIAFVGAHADDEAFGPFGTLKKCALLGARIGVINFTDSRNGNGLSGERLEELYKSAAVLGARDVFPIGHRREIPDGGLSLPQFTVIAFQGLYDVLDKAEAGGAPITRLFTFGPDGLTGHPDHVATSAIVRMAYKAFKSLEEIWEYNFSPDERLKFNQQYNGMYDHTVPEVNENGLVSVPIGNTISYKKDALNMHASQQADMDKRADNLPPLEHFRIIR